MSFSIYLHFPGTCEEALTHYAKLMDGEPGEVFRYRGSPAEEMAPGGNLDLVMHMRITVGGTILMGSDVSPERYEKPAGVNVSYASADPEQAKRVFDALSEGGEVTMPFEPSFWAKGFGMVTDRFGVPWMVNCD